MQQSSMRWLAATLASAAPVLMATAAAANAASAFRNGSFSTSLPARSLVTYDIGRNW